VSGNVGPDPSRSCRDSERPSTAAGFERAAPIPRDSVDYLVATATRAPSVHNTQPWRFQILDGALELRTDPRRRLVQLDPQGRQMLVSCGAALFGLRLAIRQLGYQPAMELLPSPAQPDLLARLRLGEAATMTLDERALLAAVRRRHTRRGAFAAEPPPAGLLAELQYDAAAEGATLVLVDRPRAYRRLATLVAAADRAQRRQPIVRAELRTWTRPAGSRARDGVPARAYPARQGPSPRDLAVRDFDLGRGWGLLDPDASSPAATAVLTTVGDDRADWLRAGQALHRVLLRAASNWVFASLHTQPLEIPSLRAAVRAQLALPGAPQMVLQLGRSHVAPLTPRRPVGDLLIRP
jgi:nitroreductase